MTFFFPSMSIRFSSTVVAASVNFKNSKNLYINRSRNYRFSVRSCVSDSHNAHKVLFFRERERESWKLDECLRRRHLFLICYAIGFLLLFLCLPAFVRCLDYIRSNISSVFFPPLLAFGSSVWDQTKKTQLFCLLV